MTAKKILTCTIKNRYSLPASRAKEPCPVSTIVAWRSVKRDSLFNRFPFSAMRPVSVIENHTVSFHPVLKQALFPWAWYDPYGVQKL